MTAKMKRLLYLILGLLAGAAIWGLEELVVRLSVQYVVQVVLQGVVLGGILGYAFAAGEGIAISEPRKALFTGLMGAGIGIAAGGGASFVAAAGMIKASNALQADFATTVGTILPLSRILAWGFIGMVIGSTEGIRSSSLRRALAGALGGLAGGLLGGAGLEGLIRLVSNPALGRAAGFAVLGLGLGLFLGEAERRFSFARLKVLTGPHKDKEYLISRRRTLLGTAVNAEVYLAAYADMESRHAMLVSENGEMRLQILQGGARVNEKNVDGTRYLKYQDVIDVGSTRLLLLPV